MAGRPLAACSADDLRVGRRCRAGCSMTTGCDFAGDLGQHERVARVALERRRERPACGRDVRVAARARRRRSRRCRRRTMNSCAPLNGKLAARFASCSRRKAELGEARRRVRRRCTATFAGVLSPFVAAGRERARRRRGRTKQRDVRFIGSAGGELSRVKVGRYGTGCAAPARNAPARAVTLG